MLPNNVIDATVEGNLSGETVKMEIDPTATAHLMSVLTDLYSDRIMAFIREYATNAWDSHVEAGVSRPIEITLPSRMNSYYKIKDYGIGLDVEGIRNIYSKYGNSTKRGSNDFNGMLGLGCKSAMTYAAQFSIISVKDGVKYNVAVSRGSDGVGEMQVIDSTPTNEANGVEIVIPVKTGDIWAVAEKVKYFFQFWPEGTVLVNGVKPTHFEGRQVKDNIYMIDGLENDLIVMGNVPYPVPGEDGIYVGEKDRFGYNRKNFGVVYFAEMGEVTFAPSRESLQTNKNTKDTIARIRQIFMDNLKASIQAEFDALPTHVDALKHRRALESRYRDLDLGTFTFKGLPIPTTGFEADFKVINHLPITNSLGQVIPAKQEKVYEPFFFYDCTGGSPETKYLALHLETIERYHDSMVFLVNAPKSLTSHQRMKMRRAYENKDIQKMFVFTTTAPVPPGAPWTNTIPVQDWSVVHNFKIVSAGTSDSTKHHVKQADGRVVHRSVPDAEKIVYVSPTFFDTGNYYGPKEGNYVKYFNAAGYSFITLNQNRHAKFKREHPNALSLGEAIAKIVGEYEKSLSENDKLLLSLDGDDVRRLEALKGLDIADKAVVELISKVSDDAHKTVRAAYEVHRSKASHSSFRLKEIKDAEPFSDYPLIRCLTSSEVRAHKSHVADYIKAVVDSKKKGK